MTYVVRTICPEIAAQPVHGVGIEVRARCMPQVRVHVQRFRRGDALEDRKNGGGRAHFVTHPTLTSVGHWIDGARCNGSK